MYLEGRNKSYIVKIELLLIDDDIPLNYFIELIEIKNTTDIIMSVLNFYLHLHINSI